MSPALRLKIIASDRVKAALEALVDKLSLVKVRNGQLFTVEVPQIFQSTLGQVALDIACISLLCVIQPFCQPDRLLMLATARTVPLFTMTSGLGLILLTSLQSTTRCIYTTHAVHMLFLSFGERGERGGGLLMAIMLVSCCWCSLL